MEYWSTGFFTYIEKSIYFRSLLVLYPTAWRAVDSLAAYGYKGGIISYGERGLRPAG